MDPVSPEYLAGFLDGEGCFTTYTTKPTKTRRGYRNPRITVSLTHLPTLERLQQEFGGTLCQSGKTKSGWKPKYQWNLNGTLGLLVAEKVLPFLITKKEQCAVWIEYSKLPKRHKIGRPKGWKAGQPYLPCTCEQCTWVGGEYDRLLTRLSDLNQRGDQATATA